MFFIISLHVNSTDLVHNSETPSAKCHITWFCHVTIQQQSHQWVWMLQ